MFFFYKKQVEYQRMKFLFGKKTEYVLMHKDIPVLKGEYSFGSHSFKSISKILSPAHMPVGAKRSDGSLSINRLNHWFHWRGIPKYRLGLYQLMQRLHVEQPLDLLDKEYALSLSDTYWLKAEDDDATWERKNFFHRDFDQAAFGQAMFSMLGNEAGHSARHTPNNTTCGFHRKAWFRQNGTLILRKGGTPIYQQEPVNEWLASEIGRSLGMDVVPYTTELYENNLVSVCPIMTDEHTDLVPAADILTSLDLNDDFHLPYYLKALKDKGIRNGEKMINEMMILDYLLMNSDRHSQNFGILIDADTMEWKKAAPVFDTGTGLGCLVKDDEIMEELYKNKCQLFNAKHFSFDLLLEHLSLKNYDLNNLDGLPHLYGEKLLQYQQYTGITNKRIDSAYRLFYKRVLALKKYAATHNQ